MQQLFRRSQGIINSELPFYQRISDCIVDEKAVKFIYGPERNRNSHVPTQNLKMLICGRYDA